MVDVPALTSVTDRVVSMADDYADRLMESFPAATSLEELRDGIAGALICFLADVLTNE